MSDHVHMLVAIPPKYAVPRNGIACRARLGFTDDIPFAGEI